MNTAARTYSESNTRWYFPDGTPCYEVPKADGKGTRPATLTDARKLHLLPSVTSILKVLDRPELNSWKMEQAVLAVMTSKQHVDEPLDTFIHRILQVERVQDQEAGRAREVGTQIHDAIAKAISGQDYDHSLDDFVLPVKSWAAALGKVLWVEKILVGNGFAGRGDALLQMSPKGLLLVDFKTTGTLPKKDSYKEHKLQTAAYAKANGNTDDMRVFTCNVYISTKTPGDFVVFTQEDWQTTYWQGFVHLLATWQWLNGYKTTDALAT